MRIMDEGHDYKFPDDCSVPKEHNSVAFLSKEEPDNKTWIRYIYGVSAYLDEPIMIEGIGIHCPLICDKREVRLRLLGHALSVEEIKEVADSA
jgi:hypothetical protein